MIVLPIDTATTKPFVTVATTEGALLLHDTFLLVALEGKTVAINVSEAYTSRVSEVLFRVTPVTGIVVLPLITVTAQVAVLLPSTVVTVMFALPMATPVTKPLADTVAIAGALLLNVTALLVALSGVTMGINCSVPPTGMFKDGILNDTPVTDTALTVTAQVAVLLPSSVVTVMAALPAAMPVTNPLDDTVATELALLLHVTFWLVALAGAILAIKVSVLPTLRLRDVLFKVTPVTVTADALTVTAQVAVLLPSTVLTVIVAVPAAMPVTKPFVTVAIVGALLLHVTALFVALAGATVAVKVSVPPTIMLVDVLFKVTPVTETGALTVTAQVAVKPPSAVVTVMLALPVDTPVTKPLDETVATAGALLLHVTLRLVALEGSIIAANVSVPLMSSISVFLFNDTPAHGTFTALTVTAQVAFIPFAGVTVMVALPAANALITPL
jgi:hypothetical protein